MHEPGYAKRPGADLVPWDKGKRFRGNCTMEPEPFLSIGEPMTYDTA
ncbi:MAG: hypothetical protein WBB24_17105 [Maribacter sp.]